MADLFPNDQDIMKKIDRGSWKQSPRLLGRRPQKLLSSESFEMLSDTDLKDNCMHKQTLVSKLHW